MEKFNLTPLGNPYKDIRAYILKNFSKFLREIYSNINEEYTYGTDELEDHMREALDYLFDFNFPDGESQNFEIL